MMVRFSRAVRAAFLFFAYGFGGLLLGFLLFPLVLIFCPRVRQGRVFRGFVRGSYRLFVLAAELLGVIRVDVVGREHLANARGCVIVANHITLIDVVILMALTADSTCVVKGKLANNIFMSQVVRHVFLVNSEDPITLVERASTLVQSGVNMVIFPEGTRHLPNDATHTLQRGAAHVALMANAPILPVRITCDPLVLAKRQPWYDVAPRRIVYTFTVGEPIHVHTDATRTLHQNACHATEIIHAALFSSSHV